MIKVQKVTKQPRKVIILMDTTYWGRNFGVMLFKDAITKENLLKYYVRQETNALYIQGINELKSLGFQIAGIVCDGRKGLIQSFEDISVQMCQFHQAAIIRRYLTKNPKLEAAKELMQVVDLMKQTDKESFEGALELWFDKWKDFLNERTINPITQKSFYTHKRLRSAFRSLKRNLPWLFTWYDYIELNIPNTTNAIDGHFADLKNKLRNHNGLSIHRKKKFIDEFLKA
ncbi:IS256 family transposase, variant Zn-binding type [Riemerella columbina]|uniref:IS256 family transposase, variant Zn-binding type n=1 Tax=Riemerella columbina TaxID=103810 RepID=UPI00036DCDFE